MKVLLIIPAYNEEENILNVYKTIEEYNKTSDFKVDYIIINDGSKDNTLKILKENDIKHINLIKNLGIGGAVQTGYKYAYENDYDIAIQFDGDGQHDINYVKTICDPIINEEYNMVIGRRYLDKRSSKFQSTVMRRFGSRVISSVIKVLCRKKITDPTSGFRAVDRKVIKEFAHRYPKEYPEPESTVSLIVTKYKIKEVPVSMNERIGGKSSINIDKSIDYMIKVILAIIIDCIGFERKKGGEK